jgi:hypothetical protein
MIGVIASSSERRVVSEFFELFKTSWEWYRSGERYQVVLCAGDCEVPPGNATELLLLYSGQKLAFDAEEGIDTVSEGNGRMLRYKENQIPIYGDCVTFPEGISVLADEESIHPAIYLHRSAPRTVARIGYDLFAEVRTLLTTGQPAANAAIPALELHIALLRDLIVSCGIPLAEVPPVPAGYRFIACLTHDVDHPSLRKHKLDHTTLGFLYRAVFGSLASVLRGRLPARKLLANWAAALKLPLVHLGLAKDFWYGFDRYVQLEGGLHSTFFVIPFKNCPGRTGRGPAPDSRAAGYGAEDISGKIRELMSVGYEIGLHGIDAWLDSSSGRAELEQIRQITGAQDIGVRMHWLYFGDQSAAALEQAGADYDSSVGYNETIGYRAGTTQVYQPLGAARLLELPLHIMDTALFFPARMALSPQEAMKRVARLIDNAVRFGGTITVNWHDRSIAPERCWGDFYVDLVSELKSRGAWFATAAETVSWYRKRRSWVFEDAGAESDVSPVNIAAAAGEDLPALQLRVHNAPQPQPC